MAIQPITTGSPVTLGTVRTIAPTSVNTPTQTYTGGITTGLGQTYPAQQVLLQNATTANQLGFPDLGNHFNTLVSELSARDKANSGLYNLYNGFGSYLNNATNAKDSFYNALDKDMLGRLSGLVTQYQDTYGPQGQQAQRVNSLYGNYSNYLLNKQAQDRLLASGLANKYGLSDNAKKIAQSDIGLQGLNEALKIFDQETQAYDNINKTFNTLTADALGKYKGIQDDYLKSSFDQNFGLQNQLAQGLLGLLASNEQLKSQQALAKQYTQPGTNTATPGNPPSTLVSYTATGKTDGSGNIEVITPGQKNPVYLTPSTYSQIKAQGRIK